MTAKGIKAGKLKQLLLPIPPIEEQQRIVRRVEELMAICSMLSSQLEAARKQSTRLAIAAVYSITGIAIEQDEEPMKAPQTELIAPLRLGTNIPNLVPWTQAQWDAWLAKSAQLVTELAAFEAAGKRDERNALIDANSTHWGALKEWLLALSAGSAANWAEMLAVQASVISNAPVVETGP